MEGMKSCEPLAKSGYILILEGIDVMCTVCLNSSRGTKLRRDRFLGLDLYCRLIARRSRVQ
jgi:hypothetical protein